MGLPLFPRTQCLVKKIRHVYLLRGLCSHHSDGNASANVSVLSLTMFTLPVAYNPNKLHSSGFAMAVLPLSSMPYTHTAPQIVATPAVRMVSASTITAVPGVLMGSASTMTDLSSLSVSGVHQHGLLPVFGLQPMAPNSVLMHGFTRLPTNTMFSGAN